jgi:polyhydroxybutyrate depolymerase
MRVQHLIAPIATVVAVCCLTASGAAQTVPASGPCAGAAASGVSDQRLTSEGRERSYRLFVPASYDGRKPLPLVLDLHGSGGDAAGQASTSRFEALAARESFLVATLQADQEHRWNVPVKEGRADDVRYVSDVIDDVAARACTDRTRVYATGFSGGARMSSLLACKLSSRIAAIAPMSGLRWPGSCDARPVPVLTLHGLADPQNTYDGHRPERNGEWDESVPDALAGWAEHNGCKGDALLEDPPGPLSTLRYEGCKDGAEVRLVRVDGLKHQWVREPIDATSTMWAFFAQHSLGR